MEAQIGIPKIPQRLQLPANRNRHLITGGVEIAEIQDNGLALVLICPRRHFGDHGVSRFAGWNEELTPDHLGNRFED